MGTLFLASTEPKRTLPLFLYMDENYARYTIMQQERHTIRLDAWITSSAHEIDNHDATILYVKLLTFISVPLALAQSKDSNDQISLIWSGE